jgi:hypothetical protein
MQVVPLSKLEGVEVAVYIEARSRGTPSRLHRKANRQRTYPTHKPLEMRRMWSMEQHLPTLSSSPSDMLCSRRRVAIQGVASMK